MKLNVVHTLPKKLYVAFSGGVDSVVLAHNAKARGCDVTLAFMDHRNEISEAEFAFVKQFAIDNDFPLVTDWIGTGDIYGSKEAFWSECRNEWFQELDEIVATGHHLDDAVEWYLMTCFRGQGEFMNKRNQNVIRPFLTTLTKQDILDYAKFYDLKYFTDPTNTDTDFATRNFVRSKILPEVLKISPGIYKTVQQGCNKKLGIW